MLLQCYFVVAKLSMFVDLIFTVYWWCFDPLFTTPSHFKIPVVISYKCFVVSSFSLFSYSLFHCCDCDYFLRLNLVIFILVNSSLHLCFHLLHLLPIYFYLFLYYNYYIRGVVGSFSSGSIPVTLCAWTCRVSIRIAFLLMVSS